MIARERGGGGCEEMGSNGAREGCKEGNEGERGWRVRVKEGATEQGKGARKGTRERGGGGCEERRDQRSEGREQGRERGIEGAMKGGSNGAREGCKEGNEGERGWRVRGKEGATERGKGARNGTRERGVEGARKGGSNGAREGNREGNEGERLQGRSPEEDTGQYAYSIQYTVYKTTTARSLQLLVLQITKL